ncbi:protein FAM114A2 isoform X2 [Colletes gigas]|nr:protein FAM114A2 isoform X2 [Colletes gigas]XP_043263302.1 protein FAM114A2 isoform X2 [Colletes gigas]XP_043263303.1 protein FAM114A2 isoform X2 [Colletes gigas]XP_043263304.1 protein FAM114A2 isoform X2 [Colletes gigas]XP_043263305.1 protein FAM114A2 isoform X2 [Colletes gigas]XP_043263306.1 protein FAM114A2 isoform X2 [Colletes gigas]XP_043263307.1 protein FAM114A2 isoform X2 [Colletes gigas]
MATSESDDFESADEEMNHDSCGKRSIQTQQWYSPTAIDSESDDDAEYLPQTYMNTIYSKQAQKCIGMVLDKKKYYKDIPKKNIDIAIKGTCKYDKDEQLTTDIEKTSESTNNMDTFSNLQELNCSQTDTSVVTSKLNENDEEINFGNNKMDTSSVKNIDTEIPLTITTCSSNETETVDNQQALSTEILRTEITQSNDLVTDTCTIIRNVNQDDISTRVLCKEASIADELSELEMPEEMKSDKKFKEVFKPEGWEGLGNEIELPEELTEEKLQPILKRLSLVGQETQNSSKGWGWGNWDVNSLINTASAGVSTLTSHVSHGLTLLEESIAIPKDSTFTNTEGLEDPVINDDNTDQSEELSSFGFGNLISGVSSITKLVESTGSKVMTGGLDTLEAIGKKTMEVLQEGDPGLKKKRAFFMNEADKPILSQVLREAKDKAETIEKTIEEKQNMRKIHFESLFDDYQGLVHLEALEMLSKQSNIKIQQYLNSLNMTELNSVQETLAEVKELCELDDSDEKEDGVDDLKLRLQEACNDLGINITYEKLYNISEEFEAYLTLPVTHTDREIFEHAISVLAQFTAFSMERFHKTAELLLIKDHRSTVNEADALVHLTHILSSQVGMLANSYCSSLHALLQDSDKPEIIKSNITTIFMEASNASSYIQDAFKLLIPIIQVGAI